MEGVAAYVSTGSRMRRIRLPEDRLIIDDCYNAIPRPWSGAGNPGGHRLPPPRSRSGDMGELGPISHDATWRWDASPRGWVWMR